MKRVRGITFPRGSNFVQLKNNYENESESKSNESFNRLLLTETV